MIFLPLSGPRIAAHHAADEETRQHSQAIYEYLVPIIKGFATEKSIEVTSLGVQVHGGMGFIEETGAAQHYRDARILTIYEGTTAIQANDLVGRKAVRDGGRTARLLCEEIAQLDAVLEGRSEPACLSMLEALKDGRLSLERAVYYVVAQARTQPRAVYAGAVNYLMLVGLVLAGWQMARSMLFALDHLAEDEDFYTAKVATARFYAEALLPQARAWALGLVQAGPTVDGMAEALF